MNSYIFTDHICVPSVIKTDYLKEMIKIKKGLVACAIEDHHHLDIIVEQLSILEVLILFIK